MNAYYRAIFKSIAEDIDRALNGFQGEFALRDALDKIEKLLEEDE
jgi:septation ring formation regulator EzrA